MTSTTETTVIAVFDNETDASAAVRDLESAGIDSGQIEVHANAQTSGTQQEGGFTHWLKSLFGSDEEEHAAYGTAYSQGGTVVAVKASEAQVDAVADLLQRHDPKNVREEASASVSNRQEVGRAAAATASAAGATSTGAAATLQRNTEAVNAAGTAIPVVEEDLAVGKRTLQRGGIRVYSRVVEEPVEEKVRLRDEHAFVNRVAADRAATGAELAKGGEQVIEVQEFAEEPVIEKRARVVEEIEVGKNVSERVETVRDTVRHTEVDVEPIAAQARTASGTGSLEEQSFQENFRQTHGNSVDEYESYSPAYTYGYSAARDPRYQGRNFADVEGNLRADYERSNPNGSWEKMKDAVHYGWDRVTGKV